MQTKQSTAVLYTPPPGGELGTFFKSAPKIRPLPNVGCLFDIYTGRYYYGKHGEAILSGGMPHLLGIAGPGNSFKSVLLHYFILQVLNRYVRTQANIYDTEGSIQQARLNALSVHLKRIFGIDLVDLGRMVLVDSPTMKLDVWYRAWREWSDNKLKKENVNGWTVESPFWNPKTDTYVNTLIPTLSEVDSLSMATTSGVQDIYDEKDIGSSDMNTESLRSMRDKSQMLMDMSDATIATNSFVGMTAHIGMKHQLNPREPVSKVMLFLKQKLTFKHVPEKFQFIPNVVWYVSGAELLRNDTTKAVEFPRNKDDDLKGDTDLQRLTLVALRNKYGASGIPFEIILSQDEGVMVGLTEFNYIRSFDRFGISGNNVNYHLDLYPDVNLSRTTIRGKIDEDPRLRRALQITSELCQMINHWDDPESLFCSPKALRDDLIAMGYDFDSLLDTRGYWVYNEDASEEAPYLSTLDMLRIRRGLYTPHWFTKEQRAQLKHVT